MNVGNCLKDSHLDYTNHKMMLCCQHCGKSVQTDEISCNASHHYQPKKKSLLRFARQVEAYYIDKLSATVTEIQKVRDDFLSRVKSTEEKIEENSKNLLFGQLLKLEPLNDLKIITGMAIKSWNRQEADCRWYLQQWRNCGITSKALAGISDAVISIIRDWEKVRRVESYDVYVTERLGLSSIGLSASPKKTTVTSDGKNVVDEVNTCTVTVRDALGNIVKEGVEYKISVLLLDPTDDPLDITIENKKNGLFRIKYLPTVAGRHTLWATLNSALISDKKLDIDVKDKTRPTIFTFGEPGKEDSQFARPWGVCIDGYGRICVSDRSNHCIKLFGRDGDFIRKFGKEGSGPGEFKLPAGIAFDMMQNLLVVADKDNHRIQILTLGGEFVREIGKGSLHYPWDVTVDGRGRIAVTEGLQGRVTFFDNNENKLEHVSWREMQLQFPRGITTHPDGYFLVTDFNSHKIVLLDDRFNAVSFLGSQGRNTDELNRPQGIAVSSDGTEFAVADCRNKCIKVFRENSLYRIIREDFDCIQGIAYHPDGSLVVVDKEKCHVKIITYKSTIYPSDAYFADSVDY